MQSLQWGWNSSSNNTLIKPCPQEFQFSVWQRLLWLSHICIICALGFKYSATIWKACGIVPVIYNLYTYAQIKVHWAAFPGASLELSWHSCTENWSHYEETDNHFLPLPFPPPLVVLHGAACWIVCALPGLCCGDCSLWIAPATLLTLLETEAFAEQHITANCFNLAFLSLPDILATEVCTANLAKLFHQST